MAAPLACAIPCSTCADTASAWRPWLQRDKSLVPEPYDAGHPISVLIILPDRDFDVTEVAVPWFLLHRRGHDVVFATEHGTVPQCDPYLLTGMLCSRPPPARLAACSLVACGRWLTVRGVWRCRVAGVVLGQLGAEPLAKQMYFGAFPTPEGWCCAMSTGYGGAHHHPQHPRRNAKRPRILEPHHVAVHRA